MFINKWIITDSVQIGDYHENISGICFNLFEEPTSIENMYMSLQRLPDSLSFSLLLSGGDACMKRGNDSFIKKIIGLFFQPVYYKINYKPLLFFKDKTPDKAEFLDQLIEDSMKQGLEDICIVDLGVENIENNSQQFVYEICNNDINQNTILCLWTKQQLVFKSLSEIHFLIPGECENRDKILNTISIEENELKKTDEYNIANTLYQSQQLIESYKHQLFLKDIERKNIQFYLDIQKGERLDELKWYHNEYEILPLWYKRFGHIIKVIMGKRTFRSLFSDKVKKYKD